MNFFTEVDIPPCPWKIDYQTGVMMIGSCFTENIGQKLAELKFNIDINPFGILYNPVSVATSLRLLMQQKKITGDDLFFDQGVWNSFYHHSHFSGIDKDQVLQNINSRIETSGTFLKNARFLIITLGTAWVYEWKQKAQVVSNCHKIPASEFRRFRLTCDEITNDYSGLLAELWKFNSNIKIVFTVSPIRHWKDGAIENQLSKATLLLAVDRLLKDTGNDYLFYFPSYEILMDELRDYRYYARDMLHLSDVAVEYIYSKFSKIMISEDTKKISEDVLKIQKAVKHHPLNSASEEYKKFLLYNLRQIDQITKKFSFLNLEIEKAHFQEELSRVTPE